MTDLSGPPGIYNRVDRALTNTLGPVNNLLSKVVRPRSPAENILLALSAMRAGPRAMPSVMRPGTLESQLSAHPTTPQGFGTALLDPRTGNQAPVTLWRTRDIAGRLNRTQIPTPTSATPRSMPSGGSEISRLVRDHFPQSTPRPATGIRPDMSYQMDQLNILRQLAGGS